MKFLVTGGSGFIGKFLVSDLVKKGYEVVATGRSQSPFKDHPKIVYYVADVTNVIHMSKILAKHKPDVVIHLAALLADECERDPVQALKVNLEAVQNLIELSIAHGVQRFVFASSAAVYGPNTPEPVREEYAGTSPLYYGIVKYAAELIGLWYRRKGLIDFRAFRPTIVFGPGRFRGPSAEYSSMIVEKALRNEKVVVKNPYDRVNYVYVRDVTNAIVLLAEAEKVRYAVYNVPGFTLKVIDFVELVKKYIPSLQYEVKPSEVIRYPAIYDDSKIREELGWRPRYLYEKAIEDYIETVRRGEELFKIYT